MQLYCNTSLQCNSKEQHICTISSLKKKKNSLSWGPSSGEDICLVHFWEHLTFIAESPSSSVSEIIILMARSTNISLTVSAKLYFESFRYLWWTAWKVNLFNRIIYDFDFKNWQGEMPLLEVKANHPTFEGILRCFFQDFLGISHILCRFITSFIMLRWIDSLTVILSWYISSHVSYVFCFFPSKYV